MTYMLIGKQGVGKTILARSLLKKGYAVYSRLSMEDPCFNEKTHKRELCPPTAKKIFLKSYEDTLRRFPEIRPS